MEIKQLMEMYIRRKTINIDKLCIMAERLTDLKIDTHTEMLHLSLIDDIIITLLINIKTHTTILLYENDYYLFKNCDVGYKNLKEFREQYKTNIENDITI